MTQPQETTEESLTPLIFAALAAWLAPTLTAVMAGGFPNPSAMFGTSAIWDRELNGLMPVLARLARPGWLRTMRDLGVGIPFDPNDPELTEILQQTRNLLVRIPDETYRQVVKSMAAGVDKGESRDRITARVNNILSVTGSENWPNRAAVIARTETNRFQEAGALGAGRRVESDTRRSLVKRWKDRDDNRVRSAHARVDNERRRLGQPFHVGRSMLQQPVDPSGFPEDVIDCRCELIIEEAR